MFSTFRFPDFPESKGLGQESGEKGGERTLYKDFTPRQAGLVFQCILWFFLKKCIRRDLITANHSWNWIKTNRNVVTVWNWRRMKHFPWSYERLNDDCLHLLFLMYKKWIFTETHYTSYTGFELNIKRNTSCASSKKI